MNQIRFFIKFLSVIYFVAFASALPQLNGLIGNNGILPSKNFFNELFQNYGFFSLIFNPSLLWLNSSDFILNFLCILGLVFSVLLFVGAFEFIALCALWFLYLSIVNAGQIFFSYQWDILLLESGFLSIFAFLTLSKNNKSLSKLAVWAYRFLLFKLFFSSGLVKLLSVDPSWRNLTALTFHYQTQPLPNWISWYLHKLPQEFQKISTFMVLVIELLGPYLISFGRQLRFLAFLLFLSLQLLIMLTGNFAFFNLLTIALCFTLLEEERLATINLKIETLLRSLPLVTNLKNLNPKLQLSRQFIILAFLFLIGNSIVNVLKIIVPLPAIIKSTISLGSNLGINSSYGLFAVITKSRPEIIIEGSNDGIHWRTYELPAKPGSLLKSPVSIAPNQPRLDWQLWFASLEEPNSNLWIKSLLKKIIIGDKNILRLFEVNPFPVKPPKFARAALYEYKFSSFQEKEFEKVWWQRKFIGLYTPIVDSKSKK